METCAKFKLHYCGPFEILERVGLMTFQLVLPHTIKGHYLFHVSLHKKYVYDVNHAIN